MLTTILHQALLGVRRTRVDVLVTFAGMAIGLTAALMMALLVRDQTTYGHAIPHHERTYLLSGTLSAPGEAPTPLWTTPGQMGRLMKADIPGVEAITRLCGNMPVIRRGDVAFRENVISADPTLFDVLPEQVLAGDPRTALDTPDGLVLALSLARKLFSQDAPLGETVTMDGQPYRVLAVVADPPRRGPLHDITGMAAGGAAASCLGGVDRDPRMSAASFQQLFTYFRMKSGITTDATDRALAELLTRHWPPEDARQVRLRAVALDRIQLDPELNPRRRAQMGTILAIVALTLAIPCINFVTLATARAGRRAVEVGIAKMSGARRRHLIAQFLLETTLLVAVAMVVAVSMTELSLPTANRLLQTGMTLPLGAPEMIATMLALVVGVGVLAGAYPALVLSAYRPGKVLKGAGAAVDGAGMVRQVLVVGQFMLLISLLSVTLVVHRQQALMTHARLSYDPTNMVIVFGACPDALRDRLAAVAGVQGVSCTDSASLMTQGQPYKATTPDGGKVALNGIPVDPSFLPLFHIEPLAGRLFDPTRAEDQGVTSGRHVILNEAGAQALGWVRPEAAIGHTVAMSVYGGDAEPMEIIGVVPDFSMGSLEDKVPPTLFRILDRATAIHDINGIIYVKLAGGIPVQEAPALADIDAAWRAANPGMPVERVFFDDHLASLTLVIRIEAQIFTLFSVVNLLMACAGIYGLSAFTAERRTKEIGVRKVYGASVTDIVRLLLWQFAKPVLLAGMLVWIPTYLGLRRWLEGFATHVEVGPLSLLAATALALVIAGLTVAGQSMRVARAKPVRALRYE